MIKTGLLGRIAIWLVKQTTGYDVDVLVSTSVACDLKMRTLWATAFRIWSKYGRVESGATKDEQEWTELENALYAIKPDSVRQAETKPADPQPR